MPRQNRALLIGYTTEKTFRHFVSYALDAAAQVDVLDLSLVNDCRSLTISDSPDDLAVELDGESFQFSRYASFYSRSYWSDLGSPPRNQIIDRLTRAIAAWLVVCPATVVNRPGSGMSNANKFAHGMMLSTMGFLTPPTLVTGAGEIVRGHARGGLELVSKSCSSTKTRTVALDGALLERADALQDCPGLFQRRVYGADVRVHWVGGLLLAERIESARVDYRFADQPGEPARPIICDVPDDVARLCHQYCEAERLELAGFDFKVTDEDEWFALEVNPMPGFESYDRRQYDRISKAVLDLLLRGEPTPLRAPDALRIGTKASPDGAPGGHEKRGLADVWSSTERDGEPKRNSRRADSPDQLFVSEDRRPQIRPFYADPMPLGRSSR